MTGCRTATYRCTGHAPPRDCLHGEAEASWRHDSDDHRFCRADASAWAAEVRPLVLVAGLGHGTADRPLALVLVSLQACRVLLAGLTFRDHREAKPARTCQGVLAPRQADQCDRCRH
jgi:hypothetical protein